MTILLFQMEVQQKVYYEEDRVPFDTLDEEINYPKPNTDEEEKLSK
ncbi:hypothetical protein GCM10010916_35200 [Paenibacillus abyssi]|uniref:Uncharacterized protein n=1 Tax=Paenibacillus abyssi TaxID=1340531 RepID=A0A917FZH3_9BACL|nr:hypothetical protein GCM10010916_35200 [Paenibacillus abyssi]